MKNHLIIEADSNQVPAERFTGGTIGKKRRVESRISDIAKQGSAHELHRSPAINSRDVMPPPPRPIRVFQTPKPAPDSRCERNSRTPAPCFLSTLNANTQSFAFKPKAPAFHSSSHASAVSDATHPPAIHLSSPDATIQDHRFSPQASAYQTNPSLQTLRQGIGHQAYPTVSQGENDTNGFWQGSFKFQLPDTTGIPTQQPWQFHASQNIHPYLQHIVSSRTPETNDSLDAITSAGTNKGSPTHHCMHPDSHDGTHQYTRSVTENAKGGFFGLIGSQRTNSFGDNPPINDGELDQFFSTASNQTTPFTPTGNRVSLPPRASSVIGTPRLRTGMSANSRSSRSNKLIPLMTPNAPKFHRKPVGINSQYGESPYFRNQDIPNPVQNPALLLAPRWPLSQAGYFMGVSNALERSFQAGGNLPTNQQLGVQPDFQPNLPGSGARSGNQRFAAKIRRARNAEF